MPSEWRETTLGEVVTLQRGFDLPETERHGGTVPVIASTGVVGCHDEATAAGPGVVIGRSGSIGGGQFIRDGFWPLNTTLWVKDFHGNDPRFCYYLLLSMSFAGYNVGGAVPTLNRNHIHPLPVRVPSDITEQRSIARILGALDDKIELNRKLNETLEQMARAIFKSWFADFEPFRDKGMVDSPLGMIPKGWSTQSLYDCAEFVNGAAYSDFDFAPDRSGLPVVKISELKDGVTPQTKFTHTDLGAKYRIDSRDMLYSWSGSPDTSLDVFIWMGGPAWLNQHIFRVDLHSSYERCFVYCLLRTLKPTLVEIARDKQTTGLGHVTTRDMKGLLVVKAPANVLQRFEESVGPICDRRMLNESESRTLAAIRDALLPKLMNGEVRVETREEDS